VSAPVDLSGLEIVYTLSRSAQQPKHAVWLEDVRALLAAAPAPATPTIKESLTVAPATLAVSVDTAEFQASFYSAALAYANNRHTQGEKLAALVAHLDAHTAKEIAKALSSKR